MKFVKLILVAVVLVGVIAGLIWWQNREEQLRKRCNDTGALPEQLRSHGIPDRCQSFR